MFNEKNIEKLERKIIKKEKRLERMRTFEKSWVTPFKISAGVSIASLYLAAIIIGIALNSDIDVTMLCYIYAVSTLSSFAVGIPLAIGGFGIDSRIEDAENDLSDLKVELSKEKTKRYINNFCNDREKDNEVVLYPTTNKSLTSGNTIYQDKTVCKPKTLVRKKDE